MDNNEHYLRKTHIRIKGAQLTYKIKNEELSSHPSAVFLRSSRVDRASELLIKAFRPSGSSVLDLGCGYGAVGLFIKALYGDQQVCLSDINERAIEYSMLNASSNKLDVKVVKSDLFSALSGISFDDIVTNPPIAAGKKLLTSLIEQACEHLNPGGALWMVAYHNKGGASQKSCRNVSQMSKTWKKRRYQGLQIGKEHINKSSF